MRLPTFNTGRSDPCNNSYALDGEILAEIDRCENDLMPAVQTLHQEKTDSAARSAQERLNAVWDLIFELPFYRDLSLDVEASRTLFPTLLTNRAKWAEVLDVNAEGRRMFEDLFSALKYFLLTNGYNTCYCNNIAPGETERTCRKVGPTERSLRAKRTGLRPRRSTTEPIGQKAERQDQYR